MLSCTARYHTASDAAAHIKLVSIQWFFFFYAQFEFAHNKWNENESFYTRLRWKRWHINDGKTLLRLLERDFSNERHQAEEEGLRGWSAFTSCSCQCINKEKIWLRVMEVEENIIWSSRHLLFVSFVWIFYLLDFRYLVVFVSLFITQSLCTVILIPATSTVGDGKEERARHLWHRHVQPLPTRVALRLRISGNRRSTH